MQDINDNTIALGDFCLRALSGYGTASLIYCIRVTDSSVYSYEKDYWLPRDLSQPIKNQWKQRTGANPRMKTVQRSEKCLIRLDQKDVPEHIREPLMILFLNRQATHPRKN